jgi:hypothetical protein
VPPALEVIKLFGMTNLLLESDLDEVETRHALNLRRGHKKSIEADEAYYPQIESDIRSEAAAMAPHYEVFYSLETAIRRLISDSLEAEDGQEWWKEEGRVPDKIRGDAEKRRKREIDSGMTPRSAEPIAFTTFGELGEIIKTNWGVFGSIFSSQKAVEKVMTSLNTLRGPIAHCSPLAEDEVVRLQLTVRDWFRLME